MSDECTTTAAEWRVRRESLGLSHDALARRSGIPADTLRRFEAGEGCLTEAQVAVLGRLSVPPAIAPPRRARLDLGLMGTILMLLGGCIPAVMMLVAGRDALRFIDAEQAVAEVSGFERRARVAEPEHGERFTYETLAPILRFRPPGASADVTIPWRETLPHEAEFAPGQRFWVTFPRGEPERLVLSLDQVLLPPLLYAGLAAPLLGIGIVSLRHLRRRTHKRPALADRPS